MRYQSKYVPIAGIYEVFDVVEQRTIEQSELISRLNEADRQRAGVSRDEFAALQQTVAAQQMQIDGMQKILIGQGGQVVEGEKPSKADLIAVLRELRNTAHVIVDNKGIPTPLNREEFNRLPERWRNLIGAVEMATFVLGDKMAQQQPATPRREPIDVQALFEQYGRYEHGKFDRVANPLHPRPDIAAMLLLDRLDPGPGLDMISSAEHDQVWLSVDLEKLVAVATEDDIITLVRCGVLFDEETDSLTMYV